MAWRSEYGRRQRKGFGGGVLVHACVWGSDKTRCGPSSIDTRVAVKIQEDRREAWKDHG